MKLTSGLSGSVDILQSQQGIYRNTDYDSFAARAFAGCQTQGAVVAQYSLIELWNPAASGVNALLDAVSLLTGAGLAVGFRAHNAALTNTGTLTGNKSVGGAAPACELRYESNATPPGTVIFRIDVAVTGNNYYPFTRAFFIPPGAGLILQGNAVNEVLRASLEWREIAI